MADIDGEKKELTYDLRQYYAGILGNHLIMIADARTKRNFRDWFDWLDSLHSEIQQKFTKAEVESYQTLLKETIKTIRDNATAFNGSLGDTTKTANVYRALKKLDAWCREVMEKHDMFGRKESAEGI